MATYAERATFLLIALKKHHQDGRVSTQSLATGPSTVVQIRIKTNPAVTASLSNVLPSVAKLRKSRHTKRNAVMTANLECKLLRLWRTHRGTINITVAAAKTAKEPNAWKVDSLTMYIDC
jgi:hypothetical protein